MVLNGVRVIYITSNSVFMQFIIKFFNIVIFVIFIYMLVKFTTLGVFCFTTATPPHFTSIFRL